jgi:hypothetical protein
MRQVVSALSFAHRPRTPNEIARSIGFDRGQPKDMHARDGRAMAPAQRVIFTLIALRNAGLVRCVRRSDGLSGTAYELTASGRTFAETI